MCFPRVGKIPTKIPYRPAQRKVWRYQMIFSSGISKKDRQCIGQKINDNDLQDSIQKTKD
jgi:hypothetical protein